MSFHAFPCQCGSPHCAAGGKLINDHETPVVVTIGVGHIRGGGMVDATKLPPFVRRLLASPTGRLEIHAECAPHVLARLLAETDPETRGK